MVKTFESACPRIYADDILMFLTDPSQISWLLPQIRPRFPNFKAAASLCENSVNKTKDLDLSKPIRRIEDKLESNRTQFMKTVKFAVSVPIPATFCLVLKVLLSQ